MKKLFVWKVKQSLLTVTKGEPIKEVIDNVPHDKRLEKLYKQIDSFPSLPFTAQRICELLLDPAVYSDGEPRKYLFALEKAIFVSSGWI